MPSYLDLHQPLASIRVKLGNFTSPEVKALLIKAFTSEL